MTLEQRLQSTAESWLAEESLSPKQVSTLEGLIRRRARRRRLLRISRWVATAAAITVFAIGAMPGVRAWAVKRLPMVGEYIARWSEVQKGWGWAEEHNMFQEVLAQDSGNGYTLRVHRVLADPTQTTIFYTIEAERSAEGRRNPADVHLRDFEIRFAGQRFAWGMGGSGETIDGVFVGSLEFDPIPSETGELELTVRRIGDTEGRWNVAFTVDRAPLTEQTRSIAVDRAFDVPGGTLTVENLLLAPTQTVLTVRYEGRAEGPDLSETSLLGVDGAIPPRGGNSPGHR